MAFRRLNDDDDDNDSNRANDYLFLCVRDSIPLPTYYNDNNKNINLILPRHCSRRRRCRRRRRFFKRHFSNYFRDEEDNNNNNNNYKFVVQL